ncbi:MAG TPA: N-acetylmuramoyl-L-alanine amidase [Spirochaetia bacterium]|nr:N-acetylmuramoyl-L-alanine amidase [Spirochaetia bacterium]
MSCSRRPIRSRSILFFFLLLSAATALYGEVSVSTILKKTGGSLEWDPFLASGVISLRGTAIEFRPGVPWALVNYREKIDIGSVSTDPKGDILFTDGGAHAIETALTSVVAADRPRIAAIIIDPGHGGIDPGTLEDPFSGKKSNLMEKNIVLRIGLDLERALKANYPDKQIIMTRQTDAFVSLEKRTEIANSVRLAPNEAKVFISIHANASFDHEANGYEVWYLPPAFERDVIDPKSLVKSRKEIYPILNAMREEEYTIQSSLLGRDILAGIHAAVGDKETDRGLKAQDWYVVRNSRMPAVLVEVGFVTNKDEAKLLHDDSYLEKLARGLYLGIVDFVDHFDSSQSGGR